MAKETLLIAGLGNPGEEFQGTYHNIGWNILEEIVKKEGKDWEDTKKTEGKTAKFKWQGKDVVFLLPVTYMNKSGVSVQKAARFWKVKPKNILIIHDDSDIELGKMKICFNKGSGGHKGVDNIFRMMKSKEMSRLKVGVRKGPQSGKKRQKAEVFILKKMTPKWRTDLVKKGAAAVEIWAGKGVEEAMNHTN